MSIQEIGFENLPNLYISEIVLMDKFSHMKQKNDSMVIEIASVVNDYALNNNNVWIGKEILSKYLKIIVVQSTSPTFSSNMTAGMAEMNPDSFRLLSSYSKEEVQYQTLKIAADTEPKQHDIINGETRLFSFLNNFKFEAKPGTDHLVYFACTYYDLKEAAEELHLDFTGAGANSYHGAVMSERVLIAGKLQTKTTVFKRMDNTIYAGPVHRHQNTYMVGSQHTSMSHDALRASTVDNLKIKDKRKRIYKNKEVSSQQKHNPSFGPLCDSFDTNGSPSLFFTMNLRSLFLNKTEYGQALLDLDIGLFDNILKKFTICLLAVDRQQIDSGFLRNELNTKKSYSPRVIESKNIINTHDEADFFLKPSVRLEKDNHKIDEHVSFSDAKYIDYQEIAKIQEVFVNEEFNLRHFEFSDYGLTKGRRGTYRYKIDMVLKDPTPEYVLSLRAELQNSFSDLKDYSVRASQQKNKKETTKGLSDQFIEEEYESYSQNISSAPWVRSVETYVKFLSFIRDIKSEEQKRLKDKFFNLIAPQTTNDGSINEFVSKYSALLTEFNSFFDLRGQVLYDSNKMINKSNAFLKNSFRVVHTFENHIEPSTHESQLDFLGIQSDSVGVLKASKQSYSAVGAAQVNKMFYEGGTLTDVGFTDLSPELESAFNDITSHSLSYLTPHTIVNERKKLDVSSDSLISMSEIKNTTRQLLGNTRGSFSLTLDVPLILLPTPDDDDSKFVRSREYLTDGSYFVRYDENIEVCATAAPEEQEVTDNLIEALSNPACRSMTQYDFLEDNNRLTTMLKGGNQQAAMLRALPNQIKALFASHSSKTKNNYAESGMNYLCKSETRNYIEVNHFALNKVEYLSGYAENSDQELNVARPIWLLLTDKVVAAAQNPLICRMNRYENPALGIGQSCTLDIPTVHKFFIISDADTKIKPNKEAASRSSQSLKAQASLDQNILYSTSNPVVQPTNKTSLITQESINRITARPSMQATPSQTPNTTTPRTTY